MAEAGGTMAGAGGPGKGVSKTVLVILIALILALGATTAYFAVRAALPPGTVTYVIGVEIAVSGGYASDGPLRRDGAFLAIDQMNAQLQAAGSLIKFERVHVDSMAPGTTAAGAFESLVAAGIKVVVGPLSSSETGTVMPLADSNKVVAISPSATAPQLAVKDYVFRVAPNDAFQARALSKLMNELGYTKVAIMARDDDYGRGIANYTEGIFEAAPYGGTVEKTFYSTASGTTYTGPVGVFSTQVQNLVAQPGGAATTAVLLVAFEDDGIGILNLARQDSVLSTVRWFGSESVTRPKYTDPATALEVKNFLVDRNMTGFFPFPQRSPVVEKFETDYNATYGKKPSPYAYYAYDAAMIAMLSILRAGKYDGPAIHQMVPIVGQTYIGASGHKIFDEFGDYAAADYRIWNIRNEGGTYLFKQIGTWFYLTGTIKWD
jgi:branched-chain amino acid transport system substrate-binding protein